LATMADPTLPGWRRPSPARRPCPPARGGLYGVTVDVAELYATTRARLLDLAGGLDPDQATAPVPALPGWSVKDAYAHLAGLCADVLDGRMDGAGSPPWTARQVAERADRDLPEVRGEWEDRGPELDAWLRSQGGQRTLFVAFDVWTHEQDIRAAVGLPGEHHDGRASYLVDHALAVFDRRFTEAGAPALQVVADSTRRVLGAGEPGATLRASDYEMLRVLFGRRSRTQIVRADWEGDPGPYVEHLHLFEPPLTDLLD